MRLFRKDTTMPASGGAAKREIGILFDIGALGTMYGKAAYRILFDSLDPHRLAGCSFHDGDTEETLLGKANVFSIAIRSSESQQIDYVRQVMEARPDAGLLPFGSRFLVGNVTDREPLVLAGTVDPSRKLVVPPNQMIQENWSDGTAWKVTVGNTVEPSDPSAVTDARRERARDLILCHLDKVIEDRPRMMLGIDYKELKSPRTLDFILDADAYPSPGRRITCVAQKFPHWVLVSVFNVVEPSQIRAMMPGGYIPQLNRLLRKSGVRRFGNPSHLRSVAHWTMCWGRDGRTAAHLAYVPAYRGVSTLMPWDLLSDEERHRGAKPRSFTIGRFFQRSLTRYRTHTSLPGSIDVPPN